MSLNLTSREIYDLATIAGFRMEPLSEMDTDDLETEFTVQNCPKLGLLDDETGQLETYQHIAYLSEYPEEGAFGLGERKQES
jgi:hypothetical protein